MSKKTIKQENTQLTTSYFGAIDTSLYFSYGVALFFSGAIGDVYPKKRVLAISFSI